MTRWIVVLAAASAAASVPLIGTGCGGGKTAGSPADGGGSDVTNDVANHVDSGGGTDGAGDTGGDAGVAPHGTQLVMSQSAWLNGVTTDDYAAYTDTTNGTFSVVSLSGGMPKLVGNSDGSGQMVKGPVAMLFAAVNMQTGAGAMTIWTAAHGVQNIGTAVEVPQFGGGALDVSADGTHLVYVDNLTATSGDITVVDTDLTNKKVLLPGVDFSNQNCFPLVFFAGSTVVAQYCPPAGDAGTGTDAGADAGDAGTAVAAPATLVTFAGAGWTTTKTISAASVPYNFNFDPAGVSVSYQSPAGLEVASIATGTSALIDATATTGVFTSDGQHIAYASGGSVYLAASSGAGTPTTLLSTGPYAGILGLSPDNNWLLAYKTLTQSMVGSLSDMYLASATMSGPAKTLVNTATASLFGDAFTADSTHAIYAAAVDTTGAGTFTAVATQGGTTTAFGPAGWINASATGAKVVFNVNYAGLGGGGGQGQADLEVVDTSKTAPATLLVNQADTNFYFSNAKDKIVYSSSFLTDSTAGVWVLPVP